ncbi:hypothetical protein MPSEU_000927400 [Mayamaea pseudoterrestris]|nr:hypothetical protein MPSEU_000927400 [Mayamaea pseudoterrestris]
MVKLLSASFPGILEATLTILLTTLEDCVWLVPLVAQATDAKIALAHGIIFVSTFVGLSVSICALAILMEGGLAASVKNADLILEGAGAILCWSLAGYFYYKAWSKKRRRAQQRREQEDLRRENDTEYGTVGAAADGSDGEAHRLVKENDAPKGAEPFQSTEMAEADTIQPWMIISLTVAGSLDEISYFPGLVVGQIFTPAELCIGTLLASLLILGLVNLLVQRCKGCLRILDKVPLYAVIALFAVILTVQVAWELLT